MAPAQLRRQLSGDLDWIVMKCLEKDRNRRYETANSLASELHRYLAGETVHACPPSATYRLKKFTLRHQRSLMVATGLVLAVLAAAGSFGWALRDRAAREAEIARAQSERRIGVERQVRDSLTLARALVADGKVTSAHERLRQVSTELRNDTSAFPHLLAEVETAQADLDRFLRFLELIDQANQAETAPPETDVATDSTSSADSLPKGRFGERRPEAAVPLLLEALRCYHVLDNDDWQRALHGGFLASQQTEQVRRNGYEVLLWLANDLVRFQHDYQLKKPLTPVEAAQQALAYLSKAEAFYKPTQALHVLRARGQETLGDLAAAEADKQHAAKTGPTIAFDHFLRGQAAWDEKKLSDGVSAFEAALRVEPTHYWSMVWLGYCLTASGSADDRTSAVRVFTGCILKRPDHAHIYFSRASSYRNLQRYDEAIADYTKAIALDPKRSRVWNGRAGAFFNQHRYREALADSSKAIELDLESWSAWCDRGDAYNSLGEEDKALSDYSQALKLNASYAPAWAGRGVAYNDLNQPEAALADLAKAIELNSRSAYAWNGVGVAHVKLNRRDEALSDFNKAIDLDSNFWAAWVNRGDRYHAQGQVDKALADYTKAIELYPQNAPAWVGRAVIYNDLNQPERALTDLAEALKLNPRSAAAWNARGVAHQKLNRRSEALSDFTKAIELNAIFWRAWYHRGLQYYALEQNDKALSDYTKAIELNPSYAPAWVSRAIAYNDLSQPEKALADLTNAIELNPRNASAWNSRGVAHEKLNQRDDAIAAFSKAIEISPKYSFAWRGRAGCYYQLLRYDEALADYSKCIELDPKISRSWYSRGLVHSKLKQPEKAFADYSKAIELNPRDASSHNNLAWQLTICPIASLRDPQRALQLAEKAVELYSRQGIFWHTLGVARYRVGKWEAAIAALKKAKELRGDDPIDGLVLAMSHCKLGQQDQARLAYEGAVQLMKRHQEDLEKNTNYTEQLLPFREEAEALLGQIPSNE
jgi:tetratricopeptide (TPR) repeat protein